MERADSKESSRIAKNQKKGWLKDLSLESILQILCVEKKTYVLEIKSENTFGHIWISERGVHAAAVNNLRGEEALFYLLALKKVEVSFWKEDINNKIKKNINASLIHLLLESARRRDETNHDCTKLENRENEKTKIFIKSDKQSLEYYVENFQRQLNKYTNNESKFDKISTSMIADFNGKILEGSNAEIMSENINMLITASFDMLNFSSKVYDACSDDNILILESKKSIAISLISDNKLLVVVSED